jgi:hypothetical protein
MTTERPDPNRPLFADMDDDDETTGGGQGAQPLPGAADPLTIDSASVGAIPLGAPTTLDEDERDPADRDVSDPRGH